MPTITVQIEDLIGLIGCELGLREIEGYLDLVKGESKGFDATTRELRVELHDTNRPDLWSAEGIARQIRAKIAGGMPEMPLFEGGDSAGGDEFVVTADPELGPVRPYVGGFLAEGETVTESILVGLIQTQEKLCENLGRRRETISIGVYNAGKIIFPVRYLSARPDEHRFVPLGFEEPLDLGEILRRHPKGIDHGWILEGLDRYPLLVDSEGKVLSFPPIINSREVGEVMVGDSYLFVEGTGTDVRSLALALNILAANLYDRGWRIEPVRTEYPYPTPFGTVVPVPYPLENSVRCRVDDFSKLLGMPCRLERIERGLREYGCRVEAHGEEVTVSTPPYRQDYMHPVDAVEDLAISEGYRGYEPILPERFTVGKLHPRTLLEDKARDLLIGFGFEEVIGNVLGSREDFRVRMGTEAPIVAISNPMVESYSVLRDSLIPSLLRVEERSSKSAYPHRVFEVGEVEVLHPEANHGSESRLHAAAVLAHAGSSYSELDSYLRLFCYYLGVEPAIRSAAHPSFIQGRVGEISVASVPVGLIGEIHPGVLERWGIRVPVAAFEIDLGSIGM